VQGGVETTTTRCHFISVVSLAAAFIKVNTDLDTLETCIYPDLQGLGEESKARSGIEPSERRETYRMLNWSCRETRRDSEICLQGEGERKAGRAWGRLGSEELGISVHKLCCIQSHGLYERVQAFHWERHRDAQGIDREFLHAVTMPTLR